MQASKHFFCFLVSYSHQVHAHTHATSSLYFCLFRPFVVCVCVCVFVCVHSVYMHIRTLCGHPHIQAVDGDSNHIHQDLDTGWWWGFESLTQAGDGDPLEPVMGIPLNHSHRQVMGSP